MAPSEHKILLRQHSRYFMGAIPTLTLGIMGSAVLPVSAAFASTGILAGFLIMIVVAAANAYTSDLLLRQGWKTGHLDYESLALAVGGPVWKFITGVSIVVLMLGTVVGGIEQIGESGATGILYFNESAPGWITGGSGRVLMVLFTVVIVAPLCLLRKMIYHEYPGYLGSVVVAVLTVVVLVQAIVHKMPYVGKSGEFEGIGFQSFSSITGAVSTFGFVFYIQPIMMPLLAEMPSGKVGMMILSWSTRIVILGISFAMYAIIGFFGAALFGSNTSGNILDNDLGGGPGQGLLNMFMSLYLALSLAPVCFPIREVFDTWLPNRWIKNEWARHILEMAVILAISLGIALGWPANSAKTLLVTGATGVMMASYVIPVVNHLLLYFNWALCQRLPEGSLEDPMRSNANHDDTAHGGFALQKADVADPTTARGHGIALAAGKADAPEKSQYPDMEAAPTGVDGPGPQKHGIVPMSASELRAWSRTYRTATTWTVSEVILQVLVPLLVLAVGMFCSIASLTTINQD